MNKNDFTKVMAIVKKKVEKIPIITPNTMANLPSTPSSSSTSVLKKMTVKQLMNQFAEVGTNQSNNKPTNVDFEVALFTNTTKTN
jgi:hypothetical protein